jgi:ABC-type transport system substrate-binding protein
VSVKRVLILAPTLVGVFLAQSYFWVPTFDDQVRGDPGRLTRYIQSGIGDASILNPALSADSPSAEINGHVFEGLIDRDLDLSFRGRLAESWRISEEAYLAVDETQRLRDGTPVQAETLRRRIEAGIAARDPGLALVERIEIEPAALLTERVETAPATKGGPATTVEVKLSRPPRLKFILREVDQDFFATLDRVLGGYVKGLRPETWLDPGLAAPLREKGLELVPATEHNPVIVFRLRKGVRFHDGHEFDSGDVRFTFETIMDPRNLSPRVPDFEPVKSVEAPDPHTVRVTYKRLFQPGFESWGMGILPEHLLNREALRAEARERGRDPERYAARDARFNRSPIGTGPFRFVEWKTDRYIRLARHDGYWNGPPNFQEFLYRILPDPLTTELTFYAGTTDEYGAQPHQVERLRQDPRFMQYSGLALGYTYIGYNLRRPPFHDVRVRTALGMAINIEEIVSFVLYGQAEGTTGPYPKQTDFYDQTVRPLPCDPAGAARLLAEAGYRKNPEGWLEKDGKPLAFTLITNSGNETRKAVMAIAQQAWRRLGIKVETLALEWAVFINDRVNKHDFDALVLGWSMGLDADIYQLFHSSQTAPFQLNFVGYRNPAADELMVRIRREYDLHRQAAMARELHQLIAADQPYTFLYVGKWTALYDRKITRQVRGPDGTLRSTAIVPTKLGSPKFHFTEWIKLPRAGDVPAHAPR